MKVFSKNAMRSLLAKVKATCNTLSNLGLARLKTRLLRNFRYRVIYPHWGRMIFKTIPVLHNIEPSTGDFTFLLRSLASEEARVREAEALRRLTFTFLNLPAVTFAPKIDWQFAPNQDPLWQYCLHYGEWALTLAQAYRLTREVRFLQALINLMTDWLEHNPPGSTPGWAPYPVARRLVAWSKVAVSLREDETWRSFWQSTLAPCLHRQTQVLAANLEKDLANNHLITNYRALAWIGLLFPDWPAAASWRNSGLAGLWGEMARQVLPDGVHDERSVSYHAIVLEDLLETWDLCKRTGVGTPRNLEHELSRMIGFLYDLQAPDGSYPMVNDTVPGYPGDIRTIAANAEARLNYWTHVPAGKETGDVSPPQFWQATPACGAAEKSRQGATAYPDAGYVIIRGGRGDFLCFDAGPMGPEHLPGHGHADALSFVLYGGDRPLIVDPGVYSYHEGSWRDYFRSTMAHNTVCIDGQDQCVFWGAFRVAYPPEVRLLSWSDNHVEGEHRGYLRLPDPVLHRRHIQKKGNGHWELLDYFEGRGEHEFALSLQLAPGARLEAEGVADFSVRWPGISLKIRVRQPSRELHAFIEPGWVSPGWNRKAPAPRYVLNWKAQVPAENCLILKVED
jgi:hypothetical protein